MFKLFQRNPAGVALGVTGLHPAFLRISPDGRALEGGRTVADAKSDSRLAG